MDFRLRRIGVGYDGGPEAGAALQVAASLAIAAGAKLCIRAIVDDRVPVLLRSALQGMVSVEWRDILYEQMNGLRDEAAAAAEKLGALFESEVVFGRPAEELAKLSDQVDLLVVGSRRWGTIARVLLGSTGEALVQCAASPLIIVPRPRV